MAETKKLLRYWEDGASVDISQKESAANEEASDDNEVSDSDDDNHMSCEDFDNDDTDVSRNMIYPSSSITSCFSSDTCPDQPEQLGSSPEPLLTPSIYTVDSISTSVSINKFVELVMQDEATAGNNNLRAYFCNKTTTKNAKVSCPIQKVLQKL